MKCLKELAIYYLLTIYFINAVAVYVTTEVNLITAYFSAYVMINIWITTDILPNVKTLRVTNVPANTE